MPMVKISSDTLAGVRRELEKVAGYVKRAEAAESDRDIHARVLALVADGQLDPSVAMDKIAEFRANPGRLDVFEAAVGMHLPSVKLGTAVDDGVDGAADTPENKLAKTVREIANGDGDRG